MGCVTCFLFWSAIILIIFKLFIKLSTGWCRSNVCLVGRTAVITGANTGIGFETAANFAKRGARVILACRNESRGQGAVDRIIKHTNNTNVVFKSLDLSSFKSVKEFARDINATEERLDILINNAAAIEYHKEMTEDGLLLTMQTNYFGHFLLTNLLLDLLKKTQNSRVVNIASMVANHVKNLHVNNLNAYIGQAFLPDIMVYARSKLCNILFTIELAERLKDTSVTTYSLHPGVVLTDIINKMPAIARVPLTQAINWFFKDALEGAQTSIYCSLAKGLESLSGQHFADCASVTRYKSAQDPELAKKLWKVSEELVNLKSK